MKSNMAGGVAPVSIGGADVSVAYGNIVGIGEARRHRSKRAWRRKQHRGINIIKRGVA